MTAPLVSGFAAGIWGGIGVALVIAELIAPGYFLLYPAGAALLVGAVSLAVDLSLEAQFGLLALATVLGWAISFRAYRRLMTGPPPDLVNRPERLVGARATVEDAIASGRGKVRLADSVWLARGPDLPAGTAVRITAVDGTVVVVEAAG